MAAKENPKKAQVMSRATTLRNFFATPPGIGAIGTVVVAIVAIIGLVYPVSPNPDIEKLIRSQGVRALSEHGTARNWIMKGLDLYDYKKGAFFPADKAIDFFSKAIDADGKNALAFALRARATHSKWKSDGEKNNDLLGGVKNLVGI